MKILLLKAGKFQADGRTERQTDVRDKAHIHLNNIDNQLDATRTVY
jgi:hypothetical protein